MSKFKTNVIYKINQEASSNKLEMGNLYLMNVPVTYAKVLTPAKKLNSEDTAYQVNIFVDAATAEKLEELGVNKELAEVGVTKIKKGPNRGKHKYSLEQEANAPYEGMFAAQFGRDTVKRNADGSVAKEYTPLKVLDEKGRPFDQEVGNGSICNVKLFVYRNKEGMLNTMLDTVVVVNHVPYIRPNGDSFDEVLGINVRANAVADFPVDGDEEETPVKKPAKPAKPEAPKGNELDFDDDIPF